MAARTRVRVWSENECDWPKQREDKNETGEEKVTKANFTCLSLLLKPCAEPELKDQDCH